jgi:RNA polymerase primary sigma factor
VGKYRIDSIDELARQLNFAPHEARLSQLSSAEELLHSIDPTKAYPIDFVIFRITGYQRRYRKNLESTLLTGLALQHDLGLLIEQLSESLDLIAHNWPEPVLMIDDVCERFNVTSKTVQRWRRRGLPARRFVFSDGKRRVGFVLSSVERYFNSRRDDGEVITRTAQVDPLERDQIIRRARVLAPTCSIEDLTLRIGRKLNRSPLTILHTLRRYDAECPQSAILPSALPPIAPDVRVRVTRAAHKGISIRRIARGLGQSRGAVYRAILDERIAKLSRRKIRFIHDSLYSHDDAEMVLGEMLRQDPIAIEPRAEDTRVPKDLPPYLADLYRVPLLNASRERALFLKFNFHKHQFVQARRRLEPQFAKRRDLDELESHLRAAIEVKNQIVRANLRLVVSIARKHLRPSPGAPGLMELISDGNITLMRAVEGFDVHKGNRFSTYSTLALMKGFARSIPMMQSRARQSSGGEMLLPEVADVRLTSTERLFDREQITSLMSQLDGREREVIRAHFGLDEAAPATYEQVGERFGLSKQRVRQIEQLAIAKMRAIAANSKEN